jgi:hypothetical protein
MTTHFHLDLITILFTSLSGIPIVFVLRWICLHWEIRIGRWDWTLFNMAWPISYAIAVAILYFHCGAPFVGAMGLALCPFGIMNAGSAAFSASFAHHDVAYLLSIRRRNRRARGAGGYAHN